MSKGTFHSLLLTQQNKESVVREIQMLQNHLREAQEWSIPHVC